MPRSPLLRTLFALLPIAGALLAALAGHWNWSVPLSLVAMAVVACASAAIYWSAPLNDRRQQALAEPIASTAAAAEAADGASAVQNQTIEASSAPLPDAGTRADALATGEWQETDLLTGLLNADPFLARLAEGLERCRRANQTAILVVCDLDGFGEINRTAGLVDANCLLRQVADCFRLTVREGDVLSRLGGDEFGIFFPGLPPEIAETRIRDLRAAVREAGSLALPEGSAPVTACLGLGCFPADGDTMDALLGAADASLARAKRERRQNTNRPVPSALVIARS